MLAWQNANRTVVGRLERRDRHAAVMAEALPFTPSPAMRRKLRKAVFVFYATPKQKRRAVRKSKKPRAAETHERLMQFFGQELVLGRGDGRFCIQLEDGSRLAITDDANKTLRKSEAKRLAARRTRGR